MSSEDHHHQQQQQQLATGIVDPNDSDVLCGRGGAALRHPGNQTYRRLVNLNKGLYTTCLKTEKLKISRSIVAAIREQQGRFLEKDSKSGTWYDIGDKKAIEKTSQALREGQPKLRQKIVEMGGAPSIDQPYGGHSGLGGYDQMGSLGGMDPALMDQALLDPSALMMPPPPQMGGQRMGSQSSNFQSELGSLSQPPAPPPPPSSSSSSSPSTSRMNHHQQQHMSRSAVATAAMREQEIRSMQPPMPDPARQEMHAEMFQRPTLQSLAAGGGGDTSDDDALRQQQQQQLQQHQRVARAMRPSLTQRHNVAHELGMIESQLSLASEFSAFAGQSGNSLMSLEPASFRRPAPGSNSSNNINNNNNNGSMYGGGVFGSSESANNFFGQPQQQALGAGANGSNGNVNSGGGGTYSPRHGMSSNPSAVTSSGAGIGAGAGGTANAQASMGVAGAGAGSGAVPPRDKLAGLDRRHVFAKMKYSRPPSVRGPGGMNPKSPYSSNHQHSGMSQFSLGDGMPDIHMVESSMSLYSNVSNMTDGLSRLDLESTQDPTQQQQQNQTQQPSDQKPPFSGSPERSRMMQEHSRDINWGGGHTGAGASSVMSLSRIDDVSIDNSIFSDLSKKMSNMSTRSVAMSMSEISVLDLQEGDNEDDDSGHANPEFAAHKMDGFAVPVQHRRQEFDLS